MKTLFVHPAIRTYRESLYRQLGDTGVHFLFSAINAPGTHAGEETAAILATFPYRYFQAREIGSRIASNFSLDLARVFRYDLVIFSCCTSIPVLLCMLPLRLLGKRVMLFDELWRYPDEVSRYRLFYPYIRFLVRHCVSAVVAAGSRARDLYVQEFGLPPERVFIAYNTTVDLMHAPRNIHKE